MTSELGVSDKAVVDPDAVPSRKRAWTMVLVGWHGELIAPLKGAARAFERLGYKVSTVGTLGVPKRTQSEFMDAFRGADVVLWWNWKEPGIEELMALRVKLRDQLWVVFNWDDPHSFVEANSAMVGRAPAWDLVFTSGEYTVPHYLALGVKEAHFLPPPVETELFYPSNKSSDADLNSGCDVNFVLTNLYSQFPTSVINRTALILALAQAAEQEPFNFQVYGPEQVNVAPAHYHGGISYDKQRQLFASCRITINTHVNNGFGGRYANERDVIVPASSGLLLVDGETPSVLTAGRDCLMMESTQPEQIAKQVVHILRNYDQYRAIRWAGARTVHELYTQTTFATAIHAQISKYLV